MSKDHNSARDHDLAASGSNAGAWPANWRLGPTDAPYRVAYRALVGRHGAARANSIVAGTDEATNADLAAWRQLGSKTA